MYVSKSDFWTALDLCICKSGGINMPSHVVYMQSYLTSCFPVRINSYYLQPTRSWTSAFRRQTKRLSDCSRKLYRPAPIISARGNWYVIIKHGPNYIRVFLLHGFNSHLYIYFLFLTVALCICPGLPPAAASIAVACRCGWLSICGVGLIPTDEGLSPDEHRAGNLRIIRKQLRISRSGVFMLQL